jgi:hypothetical protein
MTKKWGLRVLIAVLTWAIFPRCTSPFALSAKIDRLLAQKDIVEAVLARQRRYMVSRINRGGKLPFLYDYESLNGNLRLVLLTRVSMSLRDASRERRISWECILFTV